MTIREDAGRLLKFLYDQYTDGNDSIGSQLVYDNFNGWGVNRSGRINRALDYLRDVNAIKITLFIGNYEGVYNFLVTGLTTRGVLLAEDGNEFRREFGIDLPR